MLSALLICILVAWVGIFLVSDANLSLYLAPSPPPNAFKDKVVWVVGASSGIGAQLAEDFSKQSAKVILSSRRVDMLNVLADKCTDLYAKSISHGPTTTSDSLSPAALVLPLDITKHEDHEKAFAEVLRVYGRIDILVLNSGIYENSPAIHTTFDRARELMEVNFLSFVALTKVVLPHMVDKNYGKIAVVSSVAGFMTTPLTGSYSATKHALNGYYNALRGEVEIPHNIKISLICPGPVYSEMYSKLKEERGESLSMIPMSTERCSELTIKGLYHNFDELWIAEQPILAIAYIHEHFPRIGRTFISKLIAKKRLENYYEFLKKKAIH